MPAPAAATTAIASGRPMNGFASIRHCSPVERKLYRVKSFNKATHLTMREMIALAASRRRRGRK